MEQIYYTLDNGANPYKIIINSNNNISVYTNKNQEDDSNYELISNYQAKKVFIGSSQQHEGNSILIEIAEYSYVFIGNKIVSFLSYNPIVSFKSPIGNSCVPYPFAFDDKGWVYLFGRSNAKIGDWRYVDRFLPKLLETLEESKDYPWNFLYCQSTYQ